MNSNIGLELVAIPAQGLRGLVSNLLEGTAVRALRITYPGSKFSEDSEFSSIDIDATRGLLRNKDGSFVSAKGVEGIPELSHVDVAINPEKLEFISADNHVIYFKDEKFVYCIQYPDLQLEVKVLSAQPDLFRYIHSRLSGQGLYTDGKNIFLDGRFFHSDAPSLERYSRNDKGLYLDGGCIATSESGLDMNTIRQLSKYYFTDDSGKVVYRDPYPSDNGGRYYRLPQGVDTTNFAYIPGGYVNYSYPDDPGYLGLHTDSKRDYITDSIVSYYVHPDTNVLMMGARTIHHGPIDVEVPETQISRLKNSGMLEGLTWGALDDQIQ